MDKPVKLASHREFTSLARGAGRQTSDRLLYRHRRPVDFHRRGRAGAAGGAYLRIGTTGAIQPHINVGDVLVTTASVRLDGASLHFAPMEFPAVADFACTTALVEAAKSIGATTHIGVTASSDTFYPG